MEIDRRNFTLLGSAAVAAMTVAGSQAQAATDGGAEPWYKRVRRWGQVNITEDDGNMDIGFWRKYWRDTDTQGMILNAGGVVAYYPTKIPLALKAKTLGNRDLFGELIAACKADGVVCVARMTNNAVAEVAAAHPDWMCVDAQGNRTDVACMNGEFQRKYIPSVIAEIASKYRPAGFSVNGGGGHNYFLCYCQVCTKLFKDKFGKDLPRKIDWQDSVYRDWVVWNEDCFMENWDLFDKTALAAGGKDCVWIGQNGGSLTSRNMTKIGKRAAAIMMDHQARSDDSGFQQMPEAGKITFSITGWGNKIVTAAEAIYGPRLTTKAAAECQMWMYEGMGGNVTPWWHTVSAHHHDKRRYATVPPVFNWHKANEQYLYDRTPVAPVGLVWSEENNVFYGRDDVGQNVEAPWRGIINSLVRDRIPYTVVHADSIDRDAVGLSALILPNLAAMTDAQVASVKRFVAAGGGLFATGDTSLHDQFGDARPDYALADLFGAHWIPGTRPNTGYTVQSRRGGGGSDLTFANGGAGRLVSRPGMRPLNINTYLRFTPELRANVAYSPHPAGEEPAVAPGATRHPILKGFDETDVIFFGGVVPAIKTDPGVQVLVTFIPESPTSQAENAWFRTPKTDIQGLITNTLSNGARVVFMPADVDRQYAGDNNPDHGALIANAIRWTAKDNIPLEIQGPGLLDCNIYHQPGRMILHVGNLVSAATWRAPLEEFIATGPFNIRLKLNKDVQGQNAKLLVSGQTISASVRDGWAEFKIPSISSHEVVVIT